MFGIESNAENLLKFAVRDDNRHLMNPEFLEGKTGLMFKSSDIVDRVVTAVFASSGVVGKVLEHTHSLVFTHHPFNYFEDERGFQPIPPGVLENLQDRGTFIYAAHAPPDGHPTYGTSLALAYLEHS